MSDKTSELKKCPFCGGKAFVRKNKDVMETFTAYCGNADCPVSPKVSAYGKDMAINLWNTRIPVDDAVEALKKPIWIEHTDDLTLNEIAETAIKQTREVAIERVKEILNE